jgi:uncharacterized membrane protein YcaP (DUF421 family)
MLEKIFLDMFSMGLPILEKILRTILIYIFLIIGLRIAGKRELAQLNPFDLVVLLLLSNTVQNAVIGEDNSVTGGIIGATTLFIINYIMVRVLYGHQKLDQLIEGEPDVLIEKGEIKHERLKEELITITELEVAAHKQGLVSLDEVERAILEPDGAISFIAKKPTPEITRHQEILARLEQLSQEIAQLKAEQKLKPPTS